MSGKAIHLASRLAEILLKLNTGEVISVKKIAIEFGVSERTIQKDLSERLDPNLIESLGGGMYRLIPGLLGNLTPNDIKEFSELSGIIDLYPDIDDVIRFKIRDSLLVKSTINRGCIPGAQDFKELNYVITNKLKLKFQYNSKELVVEPYKLLNHSGIWYLLAKSGDIVKSYCVHKMKKVRRDIHNFEIDILILNQIIENPSPWFRENKIEVVLKVEPGFVTYFNDRNIIPDLITKELLEDKSLKVTISVNSLEEIKGIIKFWLPNIDVLKPLELKNSIIKDISTFLN